MRESITKLHTRMSDRGGYPTQTRDKSVMSRGHPHWSSAGAMTPARVLLPLALLAACTADVPPSDVDLDNDPDLQAIEDDPMPEQPAVDADTVEPFVATTACTKQRFLHVANWSFVAKLSECVNGVCPNGCWGVQERTGGFTCDYNASETDHVKTTDGGGPFASYNEIKSLNAHDDLAVAACKRESGGRHLRTYAAWNGAGWNNEGIAASVRFAEVYGTQADAASSFWTWHAGSRGTFAPMVNLSPETGVSFKD